LERLLHSTSNAKAEAAVSIDAFSVHNEIGNIELRDGVVDSSQEHFELRFGPAGASWDDLLLVALVAAPLADVATVHILIDRDDPVRAEAVDKVWENIRYYLQEKGEPNPWVYAQHHSTTTTNIYSDVRWRFFERK
jgi:hypothetical protein